MVSPTGGDAHTRVANRPCESQWAFGDVNAAPPGGRAGGRRGGGGGVGELQMCGLTETCQSESQLNLLLVIEGDSSAISKKILCRRALCGGVPLDRR